MFSHHLSMRLLMSITGKILRERPLQISAVTVLLTACLFSFCLFFFCQKEVYMIAAGVIGGVFVICTVVMFIGVREREGEA